MKKIALATVAISALLTGAASAADLAARPYTKAPPPVLAIYDWSGCYIGGHVGGTWATSNVDIPNYPQNFDTDSSSISGGVLGGCQFMTQSRFVFGIEGDYTWTDLDSTHATTGLGGTEQFHVHYDQMASVRGRLGYSPMTVPNLLLYVTGGWAAANLSQANYIPLAPAADPFRSGWSNGWIAGVGVEYAFTPNIIGGLEYLHASFDRQNFVYNGPTSIQLDTDTVRARLSYKFNWGAPVVAKY